MNLFDFPQRSQHLGQGWLEEHIHPYRSARIGADARQALGKLVWAICSVARELQAVPAGSAPVVDVPVERARERLQHLLAGPPPGLDAMCDTFLPSVLLFGGNAASRAPLTVVDSGGARVTRYLHALCALVGADGGERISAGDAFFVPLVGAEDEPARDRWVRRSKLEPPLFAEAGGCYWRVGEWNRWRLNVLTWYERLLLAALVGTNRDTVAVLAPRRLVPRIGFTIESARSLQRTFTIIPLEALPESCLDLVMQARQRDPREVDPELGIEGVL